MFPREVRDFRHAEKRDIEKIRAAIEEFRGKFKGVFTPVDEFIRKRNKDEL